MQINEKVLNWHLKDQYDLQPEDDALFYPKETKMIQPAQAMKLIEGLYSNKNRSYIDLLKLTAVATFTFTGLRYAELKGVQKADVDFKGVFTISSGSNYSTEPAVLRRGGAGFVVEKTGKISFPD